MRIEIFDVGHGQCAVITSPNGQRMMLDCGERWRDERFWKPSLHYFGQKIELLGLLNLDEDHISDFKTIMENCTVPWVLSNPTIGSREFAILKRDGMGRGAKAVAAWLAAPKGMPCVTQPDFGNVQIRYYWNFFVPGFTNKTNDLSLVVIVQYGIFKIVFTGDLEVAGWRGLLKLPAFRQDLIGTAVFVASHHGRESGCCTELFDLFRPQIVIISDDERQYDSQDTDDWYRTRCGGAACITDPSQRRYVMTTRKDGSMQIDVQSNGAWTLVPVTVRDWPRKQSQESPWNFGLGSLAPMDFNRNMLAPSLTEILSQTAPSNALAKPSPPLGELLGYLNADNSHLATPFSLSPLLPPFPTKR
jgi:beta-lactamase superfamily II metal-dependent hydrolase